MCRLLTMRVAFGCTTRLCRKPRSCPALSSCGGSGSSKIAVYLGTHQSISPLVTACHQRLPTSARARYRYDETGIRWSLRSFARIKQDWKNTAGVLFRQRPDISVWSAKTRPFMQELAIVWRIAEITAVKLTTGRRFHRIE
ncbi:hypothetical protein [Escherichia coli]|uniref:hypothetical protein n=1 Tax=Escherichia coli TaxID=562 RepID=UPI00388E282E